MTRINTNVSSLVAQNRLMRSNNDLQEAMTRLSTGLRINSGKDDPAGLIASEALRSEITSFNKAISNTNRANQIITTADTALGQVSSLLGDVRGLVVEAANTGALSDNEIAANQLQIDSSLEAINRIAQTTTFQGRKLLDGGLDFLTTAGTNYDKVANLQVDQANLGPSGSLKVSVSVTAAAEQAQITVADIPAATAAVKSTGSLELTGAATVDAKATAAINFSQDNPDVNAVGSIVLDDGSGNGVTLDITSDLVGTAGDGKTITFVEANGHGTTPTAAVDGSGNLTVTVDDTAATAIADIVSAIENEGYTVASTTNGTGLTDFTGASDSGTETDFANGEDAATVTASISLEAVANGTDANGATITFSQVDGVTTPTAVVDSDGNITIEVEDTDSVDFADIKTAIDNEGTYAATIDTSGGLAAFDGDTATATQTAFSGGSAAGTPTSTITLSAKQTGADANAATITLDTTGTGAPSAAVDSDGNITVTIEGGTDVNVADIVSAINSEGTYEAEADDADTMTAYNSTDGTATPTAFADGVDAAGGLAEDVVFELLGKSGSEVLMRVP
ncbi:B-type flagellin [Novipirellula aureliae]|uniref:B-type flagellin n=1 Tax=Novipirellula aureliae TaxID=2527966 RepID=A0A5C6DJ08_9BACT|nr:flagellin [Novipirellula aureliae]TWU36708.1 B-type flagellin [Novipirellula aureliae]